MRGDGAATASHHDAGRGSPPHARGRPGTSTRGRGRGGITPACAGTAYAPGPRSRLGRDHPRMRGDGAKNDDMITVAMGSPPHARGRLAALVRVQREVGITPACAGTATHTGSALAHYRDHPRMRGDGFMGSLFSDVVLGSPPHARGRRRGRHDPQDIVGITPACAGTARGSAARRGLLRITPACAGTARPRSWDSSLSRDHPRMRGDGAPQSRDRMYVMGSPPHARGRLSNRVRIHVIRGITPACAGTAGSTTTQSGSTRDHPRMRGDGTVTRLQEVVPPGSPPHARGRHDGIRRGVTVAGITPACAGTAYQGAAKWACRWDHPRMRGDGMLPTLLTQTVRGSPPHARGRLT